jgi:signal transduction histidine kinase
VCSSDLKAGAGQVPLAREPVQLDELVREAVADAQSLAEPGGIAVNLQRCDPASVIGDRDRLRQVLLNLCDNAVKYNHRAGAITLNLRTRDQLAEITITNTGPGISPEMLPKVFEPFFRADASHSQAIDGCGLGLSIARWIVSAHAGTINLQSKPGQITTVTVHLPCQPRDAT